MAMFAEMMGTDLGFLIPDLMLAIGLPLQRSMKSTKVQNPRCVYKPIMRVYWPRIAVQLYFPGQYLLLRRLAAACIGWGKAEPAIRPSRTILHDALNGQNCYIAVAYVVMHSPYNNDRRGVGSRTIRMRTIYN